MCIPLSHSLYLYVSVEKRGGCSDCEYAIQCATGKDCAGVARARERAERISGGAGRPAQRTILRGLGGALGRGVGRWLRAIQAARSITLWSLAIPPRQRGYAQASMHSVRILFTLTGRPKQAIEPPAGHARARAPQPELAATSRGAELSLERHVLPARSVRFLADAQPLFGARCFSWIGSTGPWATLKAQPKL